MRTHHAGDSRRLSCAILCIAALSLTAVSTLGAQSQQNRTQVVILPDPTPRQTDSRLLFPDDAEGKAHRQQAIKDQNAKRKELVTWAANELVTLSERLEMDIAKSASSASMSTEAANAEKIEQLAKSLKAALEAH